MTTPVLSAARRRGVRGALAGVGAVGLLSSMAPAGAAGLGTAPGESDARAVLLLAQATRTEQTTAFVGTQYVSAWADGSAATCVVDVTHLPGRGRFVSVRPSIGHAGGVVQAPERPGLPAPVDPLAVFAVERGPLDLLRHNYRLAQGQATATQRQVVAWRADGTVAARFWIDRASDLVVRREVYDLRGGLARASAFVDLRVAPHGGLHAPVSTAPTVTPGDKLDDDTIAGLRTAGWFLPPALAGGMVLYDVRRRTDAAGPVLHLSYSDGLSTLSVFAQEGRLDASSLTGWRASTMGGPVYLHDDGLARRITWTGGDRVYTVVTDAPTSTLAALVAAWPHKQPHRGFWGRIGHGLARLGSWLDPFG